MKYLPDTRTRAFFPPAPTDSQKAHNNFALSTFTGTGIPSLRGRAAPVRRRAYLVGGEAVETQGNLGAVFLFPV